MFLEACDPPWPNIWGPCCSFIHFVSQKQLAGLFCRITIDISLLFEMVDVYILSSSAMHVDVRPKGFLHTRLSPLLGGKSEARISRSILSILSKIVNHANMQGRATAKVWCL